MNRGADDEGSAARRIAQENWRIANDLRGSVDGWDFKSYVLGMLFYRSISENLTAYLARLKRQSEIEHITWKPSRERTSLLFILGLQLHSPERRI